MIICNKHLDNKRYNRHSVKYQHILFLEDISSLFICINILLMLLAICKKHLDKTKCISHNVKCKYISFLDDVNFLFICISIFVVCQFVHHAIKVNMIEINRKKILYDHLYFHINRWLVTYTTSDEVTINI